LLDRVFVSGSSILSSIPSFVLAPFAIILVVVRLKLLPSVGVGWHGLFAKETILPAFCLAVVGLLNVVRTTRVSILEVLSQEYVRAARARACRSAWSLSNTSFATPRCPLSPCLA